MDPKIPSRYTLQATARERLSIVHQALDRMTGQMVAIRVPLPEVDRTPYQRQVRKQWLMRQAQLQHPSLLRTLDVFESHGL